MGGDVSKWKRLPLYKNGKKINGTGMIVTVEPNEKNYNEMLTRVDNLKVNDQIIPLLCKGQDYEYITENIKKYIPKEKVDVVSLMLSLSFFWESEEDLDNLVQTITNNLKKSGKIIFLTINGENLEKNLVNDEYIINKNTWFSLVEKNDTNFGNKVSAVIKESKIVNEQIEYMVYLNEFFKRLEKHGYKLKFLKTADKNPMLSETQLKYTSLYSYGMLEGN